MERAKNPMTPPQSVQGRVAGLVLAGGRSSRFGADKATALLRGRPLLGWCASALAETIGPTSGLVWVNARAGADAESLAASLDLGLIYDDPALPAGPLTGVLAGLERATAVGLDLLITLPCDVPLVSSAELNRLRQDLGAHPAVFTVAKGRRHGLCAIWRGSLAAALRRELAGGEHPPVHRWLDQIGARPVDFADDRPFQNINRRDDLAEIEHMMEL